MTVGFEIEVDGLGEALARLGDKGDRALEAVAEGLSAFADDVIMPEARNECPVRTGYLRRSGSVQDASSGGDGASVKFGFYAEYAVYVHENQEAAHPIGKAKFLEDPVMRHVPDLPWYLADRSRAVLEEER